MLQLQADDVQPNTEPLTVEIEGPKAALLGHTVKFSASPSGGSEEYTSYQWNIDGQDKGTGASLDYTVPAGDGNAKEVTVQCTVTDSEGESKPGEIQFWQVKVNLAAIAFNYTTSAHTQDGLNIRENKTTEITAPEYVNGGANKPAAYIRNTSPQIAARFTVLPRDVTSLKIKATSSGCLGGLNETQVTAANGESQGSVTIGGKKYALFSASKPAPGTISKNTFSWDWQVTSVNGNNLASAATFGTSGGHTVYVLYAAPAAPWSTAAGNTLNPWITALDFALVDCGARNKDAPAALSSITQYLHGGRQLVYDFTSDQATYNIGGSFRVQEYIEKAWGPYVNCVDQAGAVCALARAVRINSQLLQLGGIWWYFGYINPVYIVGVGMCNNPFFGRTPYKSEPLVGFDDVNPERSWFAMHRFAELNSTIYDACAGPQRGVRSAPGYVATVIDVSTEPEAYMAGTANQIVIVPLNIQ